MTLGKESSHLAAPFRGGFLFYRVKRAIKAKDALFSKANGSLTYFTRWSEESPSASFSTKKSASSVVLLRERLTRML